MITTLQNKSRKRKPLSKKLISKWSLKEPMFVESTDKRYKRHKKQLDTNGFSDSETWNLNFTIAQFILPRLIRFKEVTICYPLGLTEKTWEEMLDKMIFAFDWVITQDDEKYDKLTKEELDNKYKQYEEGMKLFSEYFFDLWW